MSRRRRITALLSLLLLFGLGLAYQLATDGEADAGHASDGDAPEQEAGTRQRPARARTQASLPTPLRPLSLSRATAVEDVSAPGGVLLGHVLSFGSGVPIVGAELVFAHGARSRTVHTDESGQFELAVDQGGTYTLALVTAERFLPYAPEWGHSPVAFEAVPGKRVEGVRVFLSPAIEYLGIVQDSDGEPVADVQVRLLGAASGSQRLAPLAEDFVADSEGQFRFNAVDGAVLEANHPSHGRARASVDFRVQVSHRLVLRFGSLHESLTGEESISGRVVDGHGEAVPGARVVARHKSRARRDSNLHPSLEAEAGDDGGFELVGLDTGRYVLSASHPGYSQTALEVAAGETNAELQLGEEVRLSGRVVAAGSGEPIASFGVVVQRRRGTLERSHVASTTGFSGDGTFVVDGLEPGNYVVYAAASGYAPSQHVDVELPELPAQGPAVVLELGEGGTITGRVTDAQSGEALEGARVSLEGMLGEGTEVVPLQVTELTDEEGRYALDGVPSGPRSITLAAADHHGRIRSGIAVPEGGRVDVDVDLTPTEEGEEPRTEMAGIGAVLATEGDVMMIRRVVDGGGAAEVGLAPGDAIVEVDGQPVEELGFGGSIERIRGPEGSRIRLTVRKAGTEADVAINVPRRRIRF